MLRIELFFICVIVFINKFYVVENFGLPGRFDFELSKVNSCYEKYFSLAQTFLYLCI